MKSYYSGEYAQTIRERRYYYRNPGKTHSLKKQHAVKKSKLRALGRLLAFSFITSSHLFRLICVRLVLTKLMKKDLPGLGAMRIQKWAKVSNRALNVKVRVTGTPPDSGTLVVSNHRSYIDITAIGEIVPITFLAKKEVRDWPLLGAGCMYTDVVFVDRDNRESRKESKTSIDNLLKRGVSIVVFPEGTSFQGPGAMKFRPGVFVLAAENDIPVSTVAVQYEDTSDAWVGSETFFPHFMKAFSKKEIKTQCRKSMAFIFYG